MKRSPWMGVPSVILVLKTNIAKGFSYIKQYLASHKKWRGYLAWIVGFLILFELLVWLVPLPNDALFPPSSTLVFDRDQKLLYSFTSSDDKWRIRTSLAQISPVLQKYIINYEDRWFYWHPGVNPIAMIRALRQNITAHRIVSGGSTLTMQIARMIEPKARNWTNKIWEFLRAVQLEQRFSKRQLLEIYFNIAPYGGNIEGAAAAAWLYFGKEPTQLSFAEAALLAALPNSPSELRPDIYPDRAKAARNKVLKCAFEHGLIKKKDYQQALDEEIPKSRREQPEIAHHLCIELRRRFPDSPRIYSTIALKEQLMAQDLLKAHIKKLHTEYITNGAVVVIDNQKHELLAAVGSADFYNKFDQGQVNGFLAPRSPGSALKPFIYGLGIDQGLITPQHYLEDTPVDYSGYTPENYDRTNYGIVSAQEALERSLNVPAINLVAKLGDNGLYHLLRQANFSTIAADDHYGLPIAIGGCEVTLLELTALYSALACQGDYIFPKLTVNQVTNLPLPLFSTGATYIINEILAEITRPDLPTCWEFTSLPKVAWKTGTSYGHRDAWSVGYNPRYTIGVWIGNFSGEGRPGLVGAEVAAPLLFDLFNKTMPNTHSTWFTAPETVGVRDVCALSGLTPGPYCSQLVKEDYLINASPDVQCDFHQSVLVDAVTGYRLPPHYASLSSTTGKTAEKIYVKWPPRVASWFEQNGRSIDRLPPVIPNWQNLSPGQAPVIKSPLDNYEYELREGISTEFQKICLEAAVANDVRKLYWFVDGNLFGTASPGAKLFYLPEVGTHHLVCQDDQGRSSKVKLVIR